MIIPEIEAINNTQPTLIKALMKADAYPHSVNNIELIETHISWVILTGKYAYKIKKAINLGYLKATTLQERIHYCKEELRLNQRLDPNLYIGLSIIVGPHQKAKVSEEEIDFKYKNAKSLMNEKIIEVAVRMYQFPQRKLVLNSIRINSLPKDSISKLALKLADFHTSAEKAPIESEYGNFNSILDSAKNNLDILIKLDREKENHIFLIEHKIWLNKKILLLKKQFNSRKNNSAIRECHGDLHLGNIRISQKGKLEVFDSIDFNPGLRWIDPISEIAFLMIDLEVNGLLEDSIKLINKWIEETGDYRGLELLNWYSAYRCLVRAKVLAIRIQQISQSRESSIIKDKDVKRSLSQLKKYIEKAKCIQFRKAKILIIMHGLSGSGKSYLSEILYKRLSAIRIRSDVERHRLYGHNKIPEGFGITNKIPKDKYIYSKEYSDLLFMHHIPTLTKMTLRGGVSTIVDATFLRQRERKAMLSIAKEYKIPFIIIKCENKDSVAYKRLNERMAKKNDPSEADFNTRIKQKSFLEEITQEEKPCTILYKEGTNIKDLIREIELVISNYKYVIK